jgi:hypothetical protein
MRDVNANETRWNDIVYFQARWAEAANTQNERGETRQHVTR